MNGATTAMSRRRKKNVYINKKMRNEKKAAQIERRLTKKGKQQQ